MRTKGAKRDIIVFDPSISKDKKTFVIRADAGIAKGWCEFLMLIIGWAHQEIKAIDPNFEGEDH